ncbi:MAG: sigma-70 family RNA polymerase sigma factor, partial [Armatimonadetes bacterium]|nr:sigma-70 family RNA polymerase sigma factor [Armatimonadota bacterium]
SYRNPADALEQAEIQQMIAQAIEQLPEREKHIIALYYQEDLTLREIGEVLGVTESRICQIHAQAISRLHGHLSSHLE